MKRFILILSVAVVALGMVACSPQTKGAKQIVRDQTTAANQQEIYAQAQPVPLYDWSQARATLIGVQNAKSQSVATWTVFMTHYGEAQFACPSLGYPIPADAQLTNPEQVTRIKIPDSTSTVDGVVAQPEPDGTYSTGHSEATYVSCVRPNGSVTVVYWEPPVAAFPYEVVVVNGKIVDKGGDASFTIERR